MTGEPKPWRGAFRSWAFRTPSRSNRSIDSSRLPGETESSWSKPCRSWSRGWSGRCRQFGPKSKEVIFLTDLLATVHALLGRLDQAIALVNALPTDHKELGVPELESRAGPGSAAPRARPLRPSRHRLEQMAATALRLSKSSPKPDQSTEQVRGIAQSCSVAGPASPREIGAAVRPRPPSRSMPRSTPRAPSPTAGSHPASTGRRSRPRSRATPTPDASGPGASRVPRPPTT